jgi:hypothetical protein
MHENPYGVPREEIIRFILNNSSETVAQVVFGKYVESSGLVFQSEVVQQLFERSRQPILGNFYRDDESVERARPIVARSYDYQAPYYTGVDFARQTDWTVITTLDCTTLPARVVYWKRLNRVPWEDIYREVGIARMLWGPNILCDSTGPGGDVVMDALESRRFCPKHLRSNLIGASCQDDDGGRLDCSASDYLALDVVEGYDFGGGTGEKKRRLVEHLRNCLAVGYRRGNADFGWLRSPPISQLEEELTFYTWLDKNLETDSLFSLALAAWAGLEEMIEDPIYGSVYGS